MSRLKSAAWVSGDPFHAEVRRQVALYFQQEGTDSRGGARVWRKAMLMLAWLAASWATFVFTTTGLAATVMIAVSAGLAMAGIGFNVQHDGSHRSLSRRRWMNRIAAASLDLLGGSSYIWHWKHNVLHHSSPNVSGVDEDIDLGSLGRLSPLQEWRPLYRYQHVYLWFAYAFLPFKWHWYDDFAAFLRGRIGSQNIPRSRGAVVGLLIGKSVFVTWALLLPFLFQPAERAVLFYVTCCCVLGFTLSSVFQLAHCAPECFDPPVNDAQRPSWAAHQVASTVNFAGSNRLLGWYVGGLNFQIEHHLFPGVSHVHYQKLAPLVASVCGKYGVRYTSRATVWQAIRAHHRWLRHLGQAESAALLYVDRAGGAPCGTDRRRPDLPATGRMSGDHNTPYKTPQ